MIARNKPAKLSPSARRRAPVIFAAASIAGVIDSAQGISASWLSATNGTWSIASNWSTNPNFPNNGSPNPGDTYDAIIGATGASYTATLNSNVTVDTFTLNSSGATLRHSGGVFRAINGISLQAGTFELGSATISGSTVTASPGAQFLTAPGSGRLVNGIILNADLTIVNASTVTVTDGLTLNGTVFLQYATTGAQLIFSGSQTLGGTGTIVFDGGGNGGAVSPASSGDMLTIGPNITIRTGLQNGRVGVNSAGISVINQGMLLAQTAGRTLTVAAGGTVTNDGTLVATAGTLTVNNLINNKKVDVTNSTLNLSGSFNNTGSINATNSTVNFGFSLTQAQIGTLNRTGGTVNLSGTITGGLTLDATTGSWTLTGGTINGGTVTATGGAQLVATTLSRLVNGVTLNADLAIINNNTTVTVTDGLTLNGTVFCQDGSTPSVLSFSGTQTLGGTGSIVFDGSSEGGGIRPANSGDVLTIGPNITVRTGLFSGRVGIGGLTVINQGTLLARTAGKALTIFGTWSNTGTLSATAGSISLNTLPTNYSAGVLTGGHYSVFAGSTINFGASTITNNAGDIRLDGLNSRFDAINGFTTNNGTFTVANGRSFNFAGPLTNTSTGQITAAAGGSIGINGGTNSGTISAETGGTIVFNGNFNHAAASYLRGSGSVIFSSGIQDFFGNVVGDIDLTIGGGTANFRSGSSTSVTTMNISTSNSIFESGASVTVGAGGLNFTGASSPAAALGSGSTGARITLAGNVSVSGNTGGIAQILTSGSGSADGILDLGGVVRTFTIANGSSNPDLLVTTTVINGGIIKSGPGMIALSNSNSYAGGTTLSNGSFQISDIHGLGPGSVVFSGGTLDLRSNLAVASFPNTLSASSPATSVLLNADRVTAGASNLIQTGAATLGTNITVTGNSTLQLPGATLTNNLVVENFASLEIAGPITGNFGITRGGGGNSFGTLIFSGSANNTYTGTTTLTRGGIILNKSAGMISVPGDLQILGGTVQSVASDQIATSAHVSVLNGAALELNGHESFTSLTLNNGTLAGSGDVTVNGVFTNTSGQLGGSGTLNIATGATANLDSGLSTQRTINNSGTINLPVSGQGVIRYGANLFSNAGTINISGGGLVGDYTSSSPLSAIEGQIKTGYANGAWNGPGINSAAAASVGGIHKTALGYADASAIGIVGSGSFLGGSIDATSALVRYTFVGDTNLDGQVNTMDFNRLATSFNQSGKSWSDGDFDHDSIVNALDFNEIATNFGSTMSSPPALSALAPEPALLASASALVLAGGRRRRGARR